MARDAAYAPDKPFLMYWAPGASHGPHHIFEEWADRYKGKFANGWDVLRERTFRRQFEVDTTIARPGAAADVVLAVDGKEVGRLSVKRTVPAAFTASESFDVGIDLGSPVSPAYFDRRPFKFNGKIERVDVKLK